MISQRSSDRPRIDRGRPLPARRPGAAIRRQVAAAAVAIASACVTACGSSASSSAAPAPFTPGRDFVDVFNADVAGDGDRLSLVAAGRAPGKRSKALTVRVYTRSGTDGRWRATPALDAGLDPAGPPRLVQLDGAPCLGYESPREGRVLTCLRSGRWVPLPRAGAPGPRARLAGLSMAGGRLQASFVRGQLPHLRLTAMQLEGRRWRPLGPPLPTRGAIPAVGMPSANGAPVDVVLVDQLRSTRTLWTLSDRRWRRHAPLTGIGEGPQPSGPVRLGDRVFLAVTDATVSPWAFSVHVLEGERWSQVSDRLDRGRGNAQGVLRAAGGSLWAMWQENRVRESGGFDTTMHVQEVAPNLRPARRLWSGVSLGPGDLDVVTGGDHRWVLFMPRPSGSRHLTARVRVAP